MIKLILILRILLIIVMFIDNLLKIFKHNQLEICPNNLSLIQMFNLNINLNKDSYQ